MRTPDVNRRNSHQRGYTRKWAKIRRAHLFREPMCRHCAANGYVVAAEHVDHIVPLSRGGTHEPDNLQALCRACHSAKTATEDGGFGRVRTKNLCESDAANRWSSVHIPRKAPVLFAC
jgi:5-methylcytosine-specific restriction protein A